MLLKKSWLGMFAAVVVAVSLGGGCGGSDKPAGPSGGLNGTWKGNEEGLEVTLTIKGGSFEYITGIVDMKGDFSTSGEDRYTLSPTHVRGLIFAILGLNGTKWYSKKDLINATGDETVTDMFLPQTGTYVLDGNTLTLMMDPSEDDDPDYPNEPVVFTRK
jgi:hypothetical protein